jgi:hypothetical protein
LDEDDGRYPETGPEPTAVVNSSADRRHLYWRLAAPQPAGWVVRMNRRIAAWAKGDSGKAGLASVLRAPGTRNFKRHPEVDPVTLEITDVPAWEPEVLEQAVPPLPSVPVSGDKRREPYDGPPVELDPYLEFVEVLGGVPDDGGVKFAIVCPWVSEHSGGDRSGTYLGQLSGGKLYFRCYHEHCAERTWRQFRQAVQKREKLAFLVKKGQYE